MSRGASLCRQNAFSSQWLDSLDRKPKTVEEHERRLNHLFEYIRTEGGGEPPAVDFSHLIGIRVGTVLIGHGPINVRFLEEFLQWFVRDISDRELAARQRNRMLYTLRPFFQYLHQRELLPSDPTYHLVPAKERKTINHRKYLTPKESARLLKAAAQSGKNAGRNLAIVALLLRSGLRPQELCNLRISGVDLDSAWITTHGKTGRRSAPVPPAAASILKNYLSSAYYRQTVISRNLDVVFADDAVTGPMSTDSLRKLIKRLCEAAGIDRGVTTYWTRHTFASDAYRGGASFVLISEALGHSGLKNTPIYVHGREDRMRRIADRSPAVKPLLELHRELMGKKRPGPDQS